MLVWKSLLPCLKKSAFVDGVTVKLHLKKNIECYIGLLKSFSEIMSSQ